MANHKPSITSQAHTHQRQLAQIDTQLRRMWQIYRHWQTTGTTNQLGPLEALTAIDDLLEQRHQLTTPRHGENTHPQDIATTLEWGPADTRGETT